jgi:hypothetical protein
MKNPSRETRASFLRGIHRTQSGLRRACGLVVLLLLASFAQAQPSKVYPTEPAEFIATFESEINKFGDKDLAQYLKGFTEQWNAGQFTRDEQERFILQTNVMLLKNYSPNPEIVEYAKAFQAVKSDKSFAKLDVTEFFKVTDMCLQDVLRADVIRYYKFIQEFCATGAAFRTSNSAWTFSQPNPKLGFTSYKSQELNKTVYFPYLSFVSSDLVYRSSNDSTKIYGTKGDLNILNRMFNADGGKIDWSKMKLDPNDVYAEVGKYGLNLNYSFVKIDTVTFYYKSLLSKPLKGKYEDINKGYRDINKANYPYFRSYEGDVVIENFIPNVRYTGGFSLRGIKKIGSAYFKLVDIEEKALKPEPVVKKSKEEEEAEKEAEELAKELGYEYDESAYYLDEGTEFIEETWDDEELEPENDGSDEPGGDFEVLNEVDMSMFDKENKLFKAQLTIFRGDKPAMNLRALEFVLDMEKLVSKRTEVALYITEEDSITHPSVEVIYEVDSTEITLIKEVKDKFARQPFLSPYHKYYLYFDAIRWKTNTDIIQFTSLIDKENKTSAIESKDFYNKMRWNQFKGVLSFNPIGAIYRFTTQHPNETITPEAIVADNGQKHEVEALKLALVDVEGSGFVTYNRETQEITPLPKLFDWAQAARGRKDYDAIQIISKVNTGNNAELDLKDLDMGMFGVPFFSLSDSQFVRALPTKQYVKVKKNRDLEFDGRVAAGKLDFFGHLKQDSTADISELEAKFTFQYDNYKILVDSLEALRFALERNPPVGYNYSKLQKALRATTIEGVTGAIYINKPNNKNGLEPLAEYPVFDSYTNSYVYWYDPSVRGGTYTKDRFYFSIDPFVLDSLETFNEAALYFEGELYSSEIFPKMRQRLAVMPDYTLGLIQITPPDTGYAAYGKGRFNGEIKLDGGGLSSNGTMDFLYSTAKSDSFQMYFDSVRAVTKEFSLPGGERDGAYFPEIKTKAVNYKWLTKEDVIELETMNNGDPIVMFGGEGYFEGKLRITKQGIVGDGKLTIGDVVIESKEIVFREKDAKAETGTFSVNDKMSPGKKLFVSKEVKIDYDVNTHHSEFQAKKMGVANSSFPQQKYVTSLSKGTYDKTSNDLKLERVSPRDEANFFVSTDPLQDSLDYLAKSAYYSFDQQRIEVDGVPNIFVADAKITPDTGKVVVKRDGFIEKLKDAVVEADQVTRQHRIYSADIEIQSSKRYTGSGKYDYASFMGKEQFINMAEIKVQGDTLTTAKGEIKEEEKFYITERILFRGTSTLLANQRYMNFKGEVKIDSENKFFADKWFKFDDTNVNPDSVFVSIDKSTLGALVVGLHFIKRNRAFYSTFLGNKKDPIDSDVALVTGGLTFDRSTGEFRIGPEAKLTGREYRGTTSSLNDKDDVVTTAGLLNLPYNFDRNTIEVGLSGRWRDDRKARDIRAEMVGAFTFGCIPKEAWSKLANHARVQTAISSSGVKNDIDWTSYPLREGLAEFLDPKYNQKDENMDAFLKEVENSTSFNDIKVAKVLPYSLLLSNLEFRWDNDYRVLWANNPIGLIGVNGDPINKMTTSNSRVEYCLGKTTPAGVGLGDTLRIYLEFASDPITNVSSWVFFEFRAGVLYTVSSDLDGYNATLAAEIAKRKKSEGYRFELIGEDVKDNFINKFGARYILNIGRPAPQDPIEDPIPPGGNPGDPGNPGGNPGNPGGDPGNPGGTPPGDDKGTDDGEGGPLDDGMDDGGK